MKTHCLLLLLIGAHAAFLADAPAQTTPPSAPPAATPAPPPAAPPQRSAADLEKLVGPIALYPDPLLATMLPASVYPLEIVQAARFVADTNNLSKLDEQPWDDNVKAVARVPEVIKKMNDDLPWTMELGEAFLAQDKAVMDAIQSMRAKAQSFGTLKTSPQQVVIVTNTIVEKTVEQKVVVVTNTIVQIQPANPQVIYVPTYTPAVVYAAPPPSYPGLTFAAGVAVGAIIANNCDWHHGGCYNGNYHGDVNVNKNVNVNTSYNQNNNFNQNNNVNRSGNANNARSASVNPTGGGGGQQKWQPDQSRLSKSGTPSTTAASKQARGYGSGTTRPSTQPTTANRAAPSSGSAGARPSTGSSAASRPSASPSASSSQAKPGSSQAKPGSSQAKPSNSQAKAKPSASRSSSSGSAFSGAKSGSSARSDSSRGSSSRSSGSSGGSSGGGRSGGGRR